MKAVGVVIMICVETVALSGSTVCVSEIKNIVAPSARYGGVTHILMRHREAHQVSESTVSDVKFSGVKLAMNRHNGSDHNITEESQLIASNLNTSSQNTSTESVRLTVNDKISAEHRDSPGNYSKTSGKVTWKVTNVSKMGAEPFSKKTQSTLADIDPNHKRASGENPPFPAPLSVPGFTFPWTIINVTTNLVSGDSYQSNRHKSEEVASERSHVPSEPLPGPPHSTARQWRERDAAGVKATTWTSEPEEEEWMEKKVITKGYVTALSRPPYTLDHTYMDSSQDADYNTYMIYDGNLEELERRQLQPLLRFRRSDLGVGNENSKTEVTQNVTEENKGEPVAPAATTTNGTSSDSPTENDTVTPVQVSVEDPDSWDDKFPNISDEFSTQNTTVDHHRYYNSVTYSGMQEAQQYWVDLDSLKGESVVTNEMLSASHRRAVTVTLTFEFPFYGHMLKNITIATGGFLFTGDFVHTWLAATQYIAPLMANFDTSISKDAVVKYADNGTSFTVQWNNVLLKDHADAGTFTFQATLHKNGDIVFAYKQVPVIITKIGDEQHPVKVGLSDAYIVDRTIFFVRRKTIYEYHKIDKKTSGIGNWTAILFKALPTCVSLNSCTKCLSQKISFQCQWCSEIGRCSNGLDRHRQDWLHNGCEALHVQTVSECAETDVSPTTVDTFGHDASVESYSKDVEEAGSAVGTVVGVVFLVALIFGITGWVMYAYFFPHSPSGQILIRYRPSTWSWKRGEARYTAASIHSIHM